MRVTYAARMEFRSLHSDLPEGAQAQDIRRRLELTLSLWARPSRWPDSLRSESSQEGSLDRGRWEILVAQAKPVDPASTTSGLTEALLRHNGNRDPSAPEWTLASVQAEGIVMMRGSRVAVRSVIGLPGPTIASAHPWRLDLVCDETEAEAALAFWLDRFAVVEMTPGGISVGEPHPVVDEVVAVIAYLAFGVIDTESLVTLWRKAKALGVATRWLRLLSTTQCRTLAGRLAEIVIAEASSLNWHTDLELEAFAQGHPYERPRMPLTHKVDQAFRARPALARSLNTLAPPCVFAEMSAAVALAGNGTQIGNLLLSLPPGRAYFAAIDALRTHRPDVVAFLLWNGSYSPDGLVAIADWPDGLVVQGEGRMSMHAEWEKVDALARRLALFHDRGPNYVAALAFAAHEEASDGPRRSALGRPPIVPANVRMQPWEQRLGDPEHAARAVAAVRERLVLAPTDADFVVALRILVLVEKRHPGVASELGDAFVRAYAKRFNMSEGTRIFAPKLARHGDLLGALHRVVSASGDAISALWRRPFDVSDFVTRSHEEVTVISSETPTPQLDVPYLIHAHARHLVAAALSPSMDANSLVGEVVRLFEETHTKLEMDAWSWNSKAHDEETPVFTDLGRVLRLLSTEDVLELVDRILEAQPTPLQLAELLSGLGPDSTAASGLRVRLERKVGPLIKSGDLVRGHGNALGMALSKAGLPDLAEGAARYVLETIKEEKTFAVTPIRDVANQVLAVALVAQGKWQEMDSPDLTASDPQAQLLLENLRALADLERKRPDDGLARLQRLLTRHPRDPMALCNVAAIHASRADWRACFVASRRAREVLGENTPPEASVSEAQACHQLRDFRGAAEALRRLPRRYAQHAAIIGLRVALATATSPMMDELDEDLRALALTEPSTADALRSRIAMMAPIDFAGGWAGGVQRRHVSFVERCAKMGGGSGEVSDHVLHRRRAANRRAAVARRGAQRGPTDTSALRLSHWSRTVRRFERGSGSRRLGARRRGGRRLPTDGGAGPCCGTRSPHRAWGGQALGRSRLDAQGPEANPRHRKYGPGTLLVPRPVREQVRLRARRRYRTEGARGLRERRWSALRNGGRRGRCGHRVCWRHPRVQDTSSRARR